MDKNTVIAIVLSTVVIILGFSIQTIFFPSDPIQPGKTENVSLSEPVNVAQPASSQPQETTVSVIEEESSLTEERFVIETPLVKVEFTNRGGDIVSYHLKNHIDQGNFVQMAEIINQGNRAFSLKLGDSNGTPVDQLFNVRRIGDHVIGFYRTMMVRNQDGTSGSFTLAKQYTFNPDDYMFELEITIDGDQSFNGLHIGDASYTLQTSPQIGPHWNVQQDKYEYRHFFYLQDNKKKTLKLNPGQTRSVESPFSWIGVAGKYFTLIAVPDFSVKNAFVTTMSEEPDTTRAQMYIVRSPINQIRNTDTWRFYVGPRTDKNLAKYNVLTNNPYGLNNAKLNEIVGSSGPLAPLEILLKWIMELFYKLIPNWGVSIILMTILMRIVIFPLTKKSSESTLKMQELQPKIKEIQEKYKDNQQKMNEEMAKFYKTAGYNPLSGCLPMLIQFPLIFAMYGLFNNYFEFRGAMFIPGWIPDLSQGDSIFKFGFELPFLGNELRILPIIYVVSQLLFGKVTQTPGATQQNSSMKIMMYGMPLIFFFLFYNAPAGLILYWTLSNILTLVQQVIINKMMHAKKNGLHLIKQ